MHVERARGIARPSGVRNNRPLRWSFFSCAQELELLEEDSSVFKLIGPVLVKQELVEVKNNVTKRVEFIKNDMCAPPPRWAGPYLRPRSHHHLTPPAPPMSALCAPLAVGGFRAR